MMQQRSTETVVLRLRLTNFKMLFSVSNLEIVCLTIIKC